MPRSRALTAAIIVVVLGFVIFPRTAHANVIVAWNWNDGSVQGWSSPGTVRNVNNILNVSSVGNGSLQIFSPDLTGVDLQGITTISFDLSINSYSSVGSLSDLRFAQLQLNPIIPTSPTPVPILSWDLDLTGLAFGQTRLFDLAIQNASVSGSLATAGFFGLLFADQIFSYNISSASLDNFVVSNDVPEPSTFGLLLIIVPAIVAKRLRFKGRARRGLKASEINGRAGVLSLDHLFKSKSHRYRPPKQ